jgi:hypothetical protein
MALGVGLPFIAEEALTRGQAVMAGTAYPQVKLATGVNVQVLGFALCSADAGQEVAIHPVTDGSAKCRAIANTTISRGAVIQSASVTGRVRAMPASSTLKYGCGIALEAAETAQLFDILPAYFETYSVT